MIWNIVISVVGVLATGLVVWYYKRQVDSAAAAQVAAVTVAHQETLVRLDDILAKSASTADTQNKDDQSNAKHITSGKNAADFLNAGLRGSPNPGGGSNTSMCATRRPRAPVFVCGFSRS